MYSALSLWLSRHKLDRGLAAKGDDERAEPKGPFQQLSAFGCLGGPLKCLIFSLMALIRDPIYILICFKGLSGPT